MDELLRILDERFDPEPKEREDARDEAEQRLLAQLVPTLRTAVELGIGHLSLDRPAPTLSAGELQRLRLASQLRSGLFGVAYVLDEPEAEVDALDRAGVDVGDNQLAGRGARGVVELRGGRGQRTRGRRGAVRLFAPGA